MTVGVRGYAVDAAHLHDLARAAQLLEQPLGSELRVRGLVIGGDVGAFGRNRLVDGDDDDTLRYRRFDHRVQALTVGRVEDDRVNTLRDQPLQVGDLFGRAAVAVDNNDAVDKPARRRLGLDRTDHLLAPAVADERVAHAHDVAALLLHAVIGRHAAV